MTPLKGPPFKKQGVFPAFLSLSQKFQQGPQVGGCPSGVLGCAVVECVPSQLSRARGLQALGFGFRRPQWASALSDPPRGFGGFGFRGIEKRGSAKGKPPKFRFPACCACLQKGSFGFAQCTGHWIHRLSLMRRQVANPTPECPGSSGYAQQSGPAPVRK